MRKQKRDRKSQELDRKSKMNELAERNPAGSAARQFFHKAYKSYSTGDAK